MKLKGLDINMIWVAQIDPGEMPLPGEDAPEADAPRTDPETERWVFMQIEPEIDLESGQRRDSTVPMSVNDRSVALPRGVNFWCAEIFYVHLTDYCVEKKYAQDQTSPSEGAASKRYSFEQQRFGVKFLKYGGVLRENPTPKGWREGERVYGPDGHVPVEVLLSHQHQPDHRRQSAGA